jgi:RimJ/RimL family protein N-acetyltransferase
LVLRKLALDDLDEVVRIAGNFEVSKWLVPVPYPYTTDDAQAFFREVKQGNLGFIWAIEFEDKFVGLIGAGPGLGYWLCPSVWGKGLMTEAAEAVVNAYFQYTDATEIPSSYFEGNVGSARVLERAGFVETERGNSFSLARNEEVKSRHMVLTRKRWLSSKSSHVNRS